MDNIQRNNRIALVLVVVAALFYWFIYRPSSIKKDCQQWSYERGMDYFETTLKDVRGSLEKSQLQSKYMQETYNRCLQSRGL